MPTTPDTASTPAEATTPAAIATVQLRAAGSLAEFRILAVLYLGLLAGAWGTGAVFAAILMPLFCAPNHPRRALWLWAVGLLAGAMSVVAARASMTELGGLTQAMSQTPTQAARLIGWAVVGLAVVVWHLTWVKSPRRQ